MLACVPSKTIVEQRGRQVKPDRRDEGETTNKSWRSPNIDNIDLYNIEPSVTYNLQLQRFRRVEVIALAVLMQYTSHA